MDGPTHVQCWWPALVGLRGESGPTCTQDAHPAACSRRSDSAAALATSAAVPIIAAAAATAAALCPVYPSAQQIPAIDVCDCCGHHASHAAAAALLDLDLLVVSPGVLQPVQRKGWAAKAGRAEDEAGTRAMLPAS